MSDVCADWIVTASAAPAMKSATTASTHKPQPSMKIPVCPVGAKPARTPRCCNAVTELQHHRHLPDVRVGAHGENHRRIELADATRSDREIVWRHSDVVDLDAANPRERCKLRIGRHESVQAVPDGHSVVDRAQDHGAQLRAESGAVRRDADEQGVGAQCDSIVERRDDGNLAAEAEHGLH